VTERERGSVGGEYKLTASVVFVVVSLSKLVKVIEMSKVAFSDFRGAGILNTHAKRLSR